MKKLLFGALAIVAAFSLVACGEKKEEKNEDVNVKPAEQVVEKVSESGEEQIGVGNTDASMVQLALEDYIKKAYEDGVVLEVVATDIKVYSEEEIASGEEFKDYTLNSGDIVFEADYDMKIKEDYPDMMMFTASTGEIDGQWVRNKHNVGVLRSGENGYTVDEKYFGTGF